MHHPTAKSRTLRRSILPLALVGAGVMALVGCIYIPATRSLQTNGKLRPEHLVGKGRAIEPGTTHIFDALLAVNDQMSSKKPSEWSNGMWPTVTLRGMNRYYSISKDGKQFAVSYDLRVGTSVWPLCFMAVPDSQSRYLVLTVNEQNIVVEKSTTDTLPPDRFDSEFSPRTADVLSSEQAERLRAAGMRSSRDVYEDNQTRRRENQLQRDARRDSMQATQPTTQP